MLSSTSGCFSTNARLFSLLCTCTVAYLGFLDELGDDYRMITRNSYCITEIHFEVVVGVRYVHGCSCNITNTHTHNIKEHGEWMQKKTSTISDLTETKNHVLPTLYPQSQYKHITIATNILKTKMIFGMYKGIKREVEIKLPSCVLEKVTKLSIIKE